MDLAQKKGGQGGNLKSENVLGLNIYIAQKEGRKVGSNIV